MKLLYTAIVLLLTICSCVNKNSDLNRSEKSFDLFQIPVNLNEKNFIKKNISELYSNINGFTLSSEGGEIGNVDKVLIFDNKLFVLDINFAKKLFVYDLLQNGKALYSLGLKGKGPGEFLHFTDFTIDSLNRQLLTIDMLQRKISYFDLEGTFIESRKLKFSPLNIINQNDYIYFIARTFEGDDFGLKVTNRDLIIQKEFLPFKSHPVLSYHNSTFFKINNRLLLNYPNCDTIFQFKGLSINPYFAIKTENNSFYKYAKSIDLSPSGRIATNMKIRRDRSKEFENVILPRNYFEDDKIQLFKFMRNGRPHRLIIDKIHNVCQPVIGRLHNDFFLSTITLFGYDKDYGTYGIITPEGILSAPSDWLEDNKEFISEQLIQSICQAEPNNNPYIIFLK